MKLDLASIFDRLKQAKTPKARDRRALIPVREWTMGLVMAMVIVAAGGLFSYLTYTRPFEAIVIATPPPTVPYNADRVSAALNTFGLRADNFRVITGERGEVGTTTIPTSTSATSTMDTPIATSSNNLPVAPEAPVEESVSEELTAPVDTPATNTNEPLAPIAPPRADLLEAPGE